jgi:hypothetical protein
VPAPNVYEAAGGGWARVFDYNGRRRDLVRKFEFSRRYADLGLRLPSHYFNAKFRSIGGLLSDVYASAQCLPLQIADGDKDSGKDGEQCIGQGEIPKSSAKVLLFLFAFGCCITGVFCGRFGWLLASLGLVSLLLGWGFVGGG